MSVINTHSFGQFCPVSWTITHCFGVPKRFPQSFNPKVRLRVVRQHSQFWPILTRFVDYYSLFWGRGVISTINEPLSAFTSRSSIILGLSDSGLFHGLLLTVLGSQNAFHGCRTPMCAMCWSSTLVVWVGSGPFLGLYLVLGSRSDFHHCRTSGCVYMWS